MRGSKDSSQASKCDLLPSSCQGPQGEGGGAAEVNSSIKGPSENLGEQRFAWLLGQRGIPFWHEKNLEECIEVKETKPDFCAKPDDFPTFLAEIKEMQKPGFLRRIVAMAVDPELNLKRLRRPIKGAATQLKPYEPLGIPMLVILDNARRVGIAIKSIDLIQLVGDVLTPDCNQHITAIGENLPKEGHQYVEPAERERPMRLLVLHNPHATVHLPLQIFSDAEDEHVGMEEGRWINLQTKRPAFGG